MCQTFINDDKNFEEIIPTPKAITTQTNQSYWSKFEVCDCVYSIFLLDYFNSMQAGMQWKCSFEWIFIENNAIQSSKHLLIDKICTPILNQL